jgi:hypothetical protein
MLISMAQHQPICDEFTRNFGHGDRQWAMLATPERTRAYLARNGVDMDALLASFPGAR